jgi:hypothetical protein
MRRNDEMNWSDLLSTSASVLRPTADVIAFAHRGQVSRSPRHSSAQKLVVFFSCDQFPSSNLNARRRSENLQSSQAVFASDHGCRPYDVFSSERQGRRRRNHPVSWHRASYESSAVLFAGGALSYTFRRTYSYCCYTHAFVEAESFTEIATFSCSS